MRTEAELTINDLMRLARQACPMISVWPERLLLLLDGRPPTRGLWQNRRVGTNLLGWPLFLYAPKPAGHWHPVLQMRRVDRFAEANPHLEVDFDQERIRLMAHKVHGFAVFTVPTGAERPTYRDDDYTQHWSPAVQCWKFQQPVEITQMLRGNLVYMRRKDSEASIEAMRTAKRVW